MRRWISEGASVVEFNDGEEVACYPVFTDSKDAASAALLAHDAYLEGWRTGYRDGRDHCESVRTVLLRVLLRKGYPEPPS